ncbi:MAG TPA: tRNA pseudouridine(55) synthase TruB [Vicinamibacterales bacterium]|nr:tRNA pseudouridine(55) synthase TruB [Vicinamibacterales bacterium]
MDGVLLIDKPAGPTSHDMVAWVRRVSGERRIGHTGTLDPMATGLLPLVLGRATRLAALLTGGDKTYEAAIRLGFPTTTDDAEGEAIGETSDALPDATAIRDALEAFRGVHEQVPPSHSAKKIGGRRAYELARRDKPVVLAPVVVTVHAIELLAWEPPLAHVRVASGSGFYVRALARDLGAHLGCGGHLAALRRTRHGPFEVADALPADELATLDVKGLAARVLTPAAAVAHLPAVTVTPAGLSRIRHGNAVGPAMLEPGGAASLAAAGPVGVRGPDGALVAVAVARGGALHPVSVLG